MKVRIALVGAGGKMGIRLSRNLMKTNHEICYLEISQPGIERLGELGLRTSHEDSSIGTADVVILAVSKKLLDAGINLQNVTAAIGFLTQRTTEQLENITIMCDGQHVHECTDSEQMMALLQSGRAVFGVSMGSLWKQIRDALEHEEYVDLSTMPSTADSTRPVDDIAAMRMKKKLDAKRQAHTAVSL